MADHELNDSPSTAADPSCPSCGSGDLWVDYTSLVSFTFHAGQLVRASQGGVLDGAPDAITCQDCGEMCRWDEELWEIAASAMSVLPAPVRGSLTDGSVAWER